MSDEEPTHFIQSIYSAMAYMGIDPHKVRARLEHDDGEGRLLVGIPETKVSLSTEGDKPAPFVQDGWFVTPLNVRHMEIFHSVFEDLIGMAYEHRRRMSMVTTKQTSQHEQWLMDAMIRHGLPTPDRNYRINRSNGRELTTPDFAWPSLKVAFFVDGLWWHTTKDDMAAMEALQDATSREKKTILETNKVRAERDANIRSEMTIEGWKVISCSDRDLEDPANIEDQVEKIERLLRRSQQEREVIISTYKTESQSESSDVESDGIEDLL